MALSTMKQGRRRPVDGSHPALARPFVKTRLHRLTESPGSSPVPPAVPGSVYVMFLAFPRTLVCLTVGVTPYPALSTDTSVYISYVCRCNTQPHVCIDTTCHVSYVTQVKLSPFYIRFIILPASRRRSADNNDDQHLSSCNYSNFCSTTLANVCKKIALNYT